eukprot:Tbor_TRINITY_DN10004_c0_g1::TRINITY_DN10004_c0_g1_i1::g.12308::m.12308
MIIRRYHKTACFTLIFLGVMIGNIFISMEDSIYIKDANNSKLKSEERTAILEDLDGNKSMTTKPGYAVKIKWPGTVMALDDYTFRQRLLSSQFYDIYTDVKGA